MKLEKLKEIHKELKDIADGCAKAANSNRELGGFISLVWQIGDELDDLSIYLNEVIEEIQNEGV